MNILTNMGFDGFHLIVRIGVSFDDKFKHFSEEKAHLQDNKTSFFSGLI